VRSGVVTGAGSGDVSDAVSGADSGGFISAQDDKSARIVAKIIKNDRERFMLSSIDPYVRQQYCLSAAPDSGDEG